VSVTLYVGAIADSVQVWTYSPIASFQDLYRPVLYLVLALYFLFIRNKENGLWPLGLLA